MNGQVTSSHSTVWFTVEWDERPEFCLLWDRKTVAFLHVKHLKRPKLNIFHFKCWTRSRYRHWSSSINNDQRRKMHKKLIHMYVIVQSVFTVPLCWWASWTHLPWGLATGTWAHGPGECGAAPNAAGSETSESWGTGWRQREQKEEEEISYRE